jgi:hypothetical protein
MVRLAWKENQLSKCRQDNRGVSILDPLLRARGSRRHHLTRLQLVWAGTGKDVPAALRCRRYAVYSGSIRQS